MMVIWVRECSLNQGYLGKKVIHQGAISTTSVHQCTMLAYNMYTYIF